MLLAVASVIIGIAVLAVAADQFVLGAARVALVKRVPSLVVGVVIIGFGTSTPELLVSIFAAARGEAAVAVGNIVGSNIANLSLLLGIGAVIVPLAITSSTVKREAPMVVGAMVLFMVVVSDGGISTLEGFVLVAAMVVVMVVVMRPAANDAIASDVVELSAPKQHRLAAEVGRTVAGLVGTIASAQMLLWGALELATIAGVSAGFVGVTLVAIGTSLPELVTVIQSARRDETDLIVGNLLGSNLFNALVVGGSVGLVGAADISAPTLISLAVPAAVAVAFVAFLLMVTGHVVSRWEGFALILGYCALIPFLT